MKIVFVYPDFMKGAQGKYYEGIASLAALLKKNGHTVELFHLIREISDIKFIEIFEQRFPKIDLIAFSSTTNTFAYVSKYAKEIRKRRNILTICGGIHPTLCPEETIACDGIDVLCIGEGEYPLLELCNRLEKKEDIVNIQSLWIKREGRIIKNKVRPLLEDLDLLPMPERTIFDYKNSTDFKWRRLVFMASRGCPFLCAHCCNERLKEKYPNYSRYVRFKSVGRMLEEIKYSLEQWPSTQQICFHDDILTLNPAWFRDFIFRYKEEIGLPYVCNSRFDLLDEKKIEILKQTGCVGVKLGLESGNDFIRKEILKRRQDKEKIINIADDCHKKGLGFYTFNMVGIPFENLARALDTIKLNARLNPNDMQVSIFYPYPKTDLYEVCREKGFLTNKTLPSYVERDTVLKLNDFPKQEILFAYDNFVHFVEYYEFLSLLLPKRFCKFSINILDFLWVHPKIYFLIRPMLMCCRYLYKFIRKFKQWQRALRIKRKAGK